MVPFLAAVSYSNNPFLDGDTILNWCASSSILDCMKDDQPWEVIVRRLNLIGIPARGVGKEAHLEWGLPSTDVWELSAVRSDASDMYIPQAPSEPYQRWSDPAAVGPHRA